MHVVILAGGSGTRMGGKTPKPLVKMNGKALILHVIDNVRSAFKDVKVRVVVGKKNSSEIKKQLGNDFEYILQPKALGTADALKYGIEGMNENENVLVMYADTPLIRPSSISGIFNFHVLKKADVTLLTGLSSRKYPYALVLKDDFKKLLAVKEEMRPTSLPPWEYNIGMYVFKVKKILSLFKKVKPADKGEYYIPELVNIAIDKKLKVQTYMSFDESEYLGVNTKEDLRRAENVMAEREIEELEIKQERFIHFGTGGWRAKIGRGFTSRNLRRVSQAIANYLIRKGLNDKGIVIGYDNRFLSETFAKIAGEVFAANNIKVYLSNSSLPTPIVTFTVLEKKAGGGVILTASHNPPEYNGVKFETHEGLPSPADVTSKIEKEANSFDVNSIPWIPLEKAMDAGYVEIEDFRGTYLDYLEKKINIKSIKEAQIRVCFDSMYGSGASTIQFALVSARCDLTMLHARRDPLFGGISPAPSEKSLTTLINTVREGNYDIGIAVDGDADRIAIVDEKGKFIHPNEIILLLYYYLHEVKGKKGGVVRNVSTTHNLDILAQLMGEEVYEVPVGFKHIAKAMVDHKALIGGESSGGVTFRGHIMEKDSVYTSMLVLEMLSTMKKPLSLIMKELFSKMGKRFFFQEDDLKLTPELKVRAMKFLSQKLKEISSKKIVEIREIDGKKFVLEDGSWILTRFSGTEPILRIASEAHTKGEAKKMNSWLKRQMTSTKF
jgi:phosphomannomutase/GTP:adenosylcobinamide-phosphate guanylyltransferase